MLLVLFCTIKISPQPVLKSSIGLSHLPSDAAAISTIPVYWDNSHTFLAPGLQTGDTIPRFKLYTPDNHPVDIADVMTDGKPVLLIGGSYTCPIFRGKIESINAMANEYKDRIHIFVIYTVEAHPNGPDRSPYSGNVWTLAANIENNISYSQPRTYADRKNAAKDMMAAITLKVPVLLDGPGNEWWTTFGTAPNSAFLIHPNGTIFEKQGWLNADRAPMTYFIDSLLDLLHGKSHTATKNTLVMKDEDQQVHFTLGKEVASTTITFYDRFGCSENTTSFAGRRALLSKETLIAGLHTYFIHAGDDIFCGQFMVKKECGENKVSKASACNDASFCRN